MMTKLASTGTSPLFDLADGTWTSLVSSYFTMPIPAAPVIPITCLESRRPAHQCGRVGLSLFTNDDEFPGWAGHRSCAIMPRASRSASKSTSFVARSPSSRSSSSGRWRSTGPFFMENLVRAGPSVIGLKRSADRSGPRHSPGCSALTDRAGHRDRDARPGVHECRAPASPLDR